MALEPGSVVADKYRIVRLLGSGAMGQVWEATHTLTERGVALKVLSENHQTQEARVRILREARALGRIQHKNVIEIFDVGELPDGAPFLVMQLLKGETLDDRLDRLGKLPPPEVQIVALGMARALEAAHRAGIVHRDLKPGNVFLHWDADSPDPVVKVLDFGISKILTNDVAYTDAGRAVGSPAYMSPEQARGEPDIDARTDLWAFGIVLYEALTGGLPFPGETPYAMVGQILHGAMPDFPRLCPDASAKHMNVLLRCVVRERELRLPSATTLRELLEGSSNEAFAPRADAPPPPAFEPTRVAAGAPASLVTSVELPRQATRSGRRGLWGIAGGFAFVAVAAAGVLWWRTTLRSPAASEPTPPRTTASESAVAPSASTPSPSVAPVEVTATAASSSAATESAATESAATESAAPATTAPTPKVRGPRPIKKPSTTSRVTLPDGPG